MSICTRTTAAAGSGRRGNGADGDDPSARAPLAEGWGTAEMVRTGQAGQRNIPSLRTFARRATSRRGRVPSSLSPFHGGEHRRLACTVNRPGTRTVRRAGRRPRSRARHVSTWWRRSRTGHMCPITMTRAAVAALAAAPDIACASGCRRSCLAPTTRLRPFEGRSGVTLGMGMTEKQGGTDVRANTTRAMRGRRRLTASPAKNGSCRRRCRMRSWCWRRHRAG